MNRETNGGKYKDDQRICKENMKAERKKSENIRHFLKTIRERHRRRYVAKTAAYKNN